MNTKITIFLLIIILILSISTYIIFNKYILSSKQKCKPITFKKNQEDIVYDIFIDLEINTLYLFKNKEIIDKYPVASGKTDTPSPSGVWRINHKACWGEGFGGHWLGLNVPWGIYGIHGTTKPSSIGKRASHGCIRMFNEDAKSLYNIIPYQTKVYIYSGPYGVYSNDYRILKPGDSGSDVMNVQLVLRKKGYYKGAIDGLYGELMKKALIEYEKENNLIVSEYIYDETYRKLGLFPME